MYPSPWFRLGSVDRIKSMWQGDRGCRRHPRRPLHMIPSLHFPTWRRSRTRLALIAGCALGMAVLSPATYAHDQHYGLVVDVKRIYSHHDAYRPQLQCSYYDRGHNRGHRRGHSNAGPIVGGIVGGVIGNRLGSRNSNRGFRSGQGRNHRGGSLGGTVAGAIVGAAIGQGVSRGHGRHNRHQGKHCVEVHQPQRQRRPYPWSLLPCPRQASN